LKIAYIIEVLVLALTLKSEHNLCVYRHKYTKTYYYNYKLY